MRPLRLTAYHKSRCLSKKNSQILIANRLLHAAVYSQLCYELARDVEEQDFPWDDDGVQQLQDWLQSHYDAYCAAHA